MKEEIRRQAQELGFDLCAFTSAAPPDSADAFGQWLAAGYQGEMAWLESSLAKRSDPQMILPNAKTVIVLAASYGRAEDIQEDRGQKPEVGGQRSPVRGQRPQLGSSPPSASTGVVARYARYTDYHQVFGERLRTLADWLNHLGGQGTRSLWYVDTGPLLERDFAQRAGLGFIGKHTNLISRRLGNWILLAEIITTLELPPDPPERNRCGSCSRCITACPTAAIVAPFRLDARRCISYLTIELKGPIPPTLRPAIGNRIFGCDDCLAACPWNRFAQKAKLMQSYDRRDLEGPNLLDLLALDEAGFRARFKGTPIQRLKRRGLLRNVCVALGNVGDAMALPALSWAAAASDPLVAEHAAWAVQQIRTRLNSRRSA